MYGLSPTGLRALGTGDSAALMASSGAVDRVALPLRAQAKSIAADTGGFMINSPAQFNEGITRVFRETGSYYLLGYRSTNPPAKFHATDVRANTPGLVVQTHPGYVTTKPERPAKETAPALTLALAGVLPKADLPLRVTAAPFAVPGTSEAEVAIALGIQEPVGSMRAVDRIGLQVRAFTFHGDPRGVTEEQLDLFVPPGNAGDSYVDLLSRLRLKPGRYELRLSARSDRLDRDGSAYIDLDVPDFTTAPVSLSGVVFSMPSGLAAAPPDALKSIVPVVPTTERAFRRLDRPTAFLRIYQGGSGRLAPVTLLVKIRDSQGQTVFGNAQTLDGDRFTSARAAEESFALPLTQLTPGRYLLSFEASAGKTTARRDVRFSVK